MRIGAAGLGFLLGFLELFSNSANADIFQIDYAGVTKFNSPLYFLDGCTSQFGCIVNAGTAFNATLVFDTSLGVLSSPSPGINEVTNSATTRPLVRASINIVGIGTYTNTGFFFSNFIWSDDLSFFQAIAKDNGGLFNIEFDYSDFYQTGVCPGFPCGELTVNSAALTDLSTPTPPALPVPWSVVGGGFPGALLAAAWTALFVRKRREFLVRDKL